MKSHIIYSQHFNFSDEFKKDLTSYIEWEKSPNLIVTGRSGYVKFDNPTTEANLELIKLKGLGFFDAQSNTHIKPGETAYDGGKQVNDQGITELANRLIVTKDGHFEIEEFEEKPFGGQFMKRVDAEFKVAETLYTPGKPLITYIPIAKALYEGIQFDGKPIGVVVLGLPSQNLTFLEEYFISRLQDGQMMISNRLNPRSAPDQIFELLNDFCAQIGYKLHGLHQHFVGMEGHLGNCTVIPEKKEVILHDLDYLKSTNSLPPVQEFNFRIRDIASYLTAIITNTLFNDLLSFAPQLELCEANYFQFNFLRSLLEGYNPAIPESLDNKLDLIWKEVLEFYLEHLQDLSSKERLIRIHPFIVEKKINLLEDLFVIMETTFQSEGKHLSYTEKSHHKNIAQLAKSFESVSN